MKKSKLCSMFMALSLAAQLASVPVFAEETGGGIYHSGDFAESKIILTVTDDNAPCDHETKEYTDNGDGTHTYSCAYCGEPFSTDEVHVDEDSNGYCDKCWATVETDCKHESTAFVDNKDGTHSERCSECDDMVSGPDEHTDGDGDGSCDSCGADMDASEPILIATVPLQLPVIMDGVGSITVAKDAVITNHQERSVAVSSIDVFAGEGWEQVPLIYDFTEENEAVFGLSFRGIDVYELSPVGFDNNEIWTIAGNDALNLNMAINIPKQTELRHEEELATVSFVLGWAVDENAPTGAADLGANGQDAINATKSSS